MAERDRIAAQSAHPPYAAFGDDGAALRSNLTDGGHRRDYGPKGCAGIVLKTAAFSGLVAAMAVLKTLGVL